MLWNKAKGNGVSRAIKDPTSIGNILLHHGYITQAQLEEAKQYQADYPDILMGESLVRLGYLGRAELEVACRQQTLLRGHRATTKALMQTTRVATQRTTEFALSLQSFALLGD